MLIESELINGALNKLTGDEHGISVQGPLPPACSWEFVPCLRRLIYIQNWSDKLNDFPHVIKQFKEQYSVWNQKYPTDKVKKSSDDVHTHEDCHLGGKPRCWTGYAVLPSHCPPNRETNKIPQMEWFCLTLPCILEQAPHSSGHGLASNSRRFIRFSAGW